MKTARDLIAVMSGFGIPDAVFSCFPHNHILQVKESERGNVIVLHGILHDRKKRLPEKEKGMDRLCLPGFCHAWHADSAVHRQYVPSVHGAPFPHVSENAGTDYAGSEFCRLHLPGAEVFQIRHSLRCRPGPADVLDACISTPWSASLCWGSPKQSFPARLWRSCTAGTCSLRTGKSKRRGRKPARLRKNPKKTCDFLRRNCEFFPFRPASLDNRAKVKYNTSQLGGSTGGYARRCAGPFDTAERARSAKRRPAFLLAEKTCKRPGPAARRGTRD